MKIQNDNSKIESNNQLPNSSYKVWSAATFATVLVSTAIFVVKGNKFPGISSFLQRTFRKKPVTKIQVPSYLRKPNENPDIPSGVK